MLTLQDAQDIAAWVIRTRPLAQAVRIAYHVTPHDAPFSVTWQESGSTRELDTVEKALRAGWEG